MEICVTEAEKRETGTLNIRDFYTVYLIETKLVNLDSVTQFLNLSVYFIQFIYVTISPSVMPLHGMDP
jgi:hypothetical protein